jgi:hypothetical protein
MLSRGGHHGAKSTDVHGNLIGHDVGANTVLALWAPSGLLEAKPGSPFSTGLGPVDNRVTKVHQTSSAQCAVRSSQIVRSAQAATRICSIRR